MLGKDDEIEKESKYRKREEGKWKGWEKKKCEERKEKRN